MLDTIIDTPLDMLLTARYVRCFAAADCRRHA